MGAPAPDGSCSPTSQPLLHVVSERASGERKALSRRRTGETLRAACSDDHVGDESRGEAEHHTPVQQFHSAHLAGYPKKLDHNVENGACRDRKEQRAHHVARELVSDDGSYERWSATYQAHREKEAPRGTFAFGGERCHDPNPSVAL